MRYHHVADDDHPPEAEFVQYALDLSDAGPVKVHAGRPGRDADDRPGVQPGRGAGPSDCFIY